MMNTKLMIRSLRRFARHTAVDALAAWNEQFGREAKLGMRRVHILLLHHVTGEEVAHFRRLLQSLAREYQFIGYSEAVTRIVENRIDRTYLAFSFDDGLKNGLRAASLLADVGARACYFVCPSIIGERDASTIACFCRERLRHPPEDFLDWRDIEQLMAGGHEIGGHTMRHSMLSRIGGLEARDEIYETYAVLRTHVGSVQHFAWPYGRFADVTRDVVQTVFDAGFRSCASGERGCHGPILSKAADSSFCPEHLCLRRESIVAGWPVPHVRYFLSRAARRPLAIDDTWPAALRPICKNDSHKPCTSQSMPSPSSPAAA
jgi:hypothetical protein